MRGRTGRVTVTRAWKLFESVIIIETRAVTLSLRPWPGVTEPEPGGPPAGGDKLASACLARTCLEGTVTVRGRGKLVSLSLTRRSRSESLAA